MKNKLAITFEENHVRVRADGEEDIEYLKPLIINRYFDAVSLSCLRNSAGKIVGFLGVSDDNIEMLFVGSEYRGRSVGKRLLRHAVDNLAARKVDVNEQNEQAVGFYKHLGFDVVGRSPLDGQGRPFPLLHMELM